MSASFRDELTRLANPTVAAAIYKEADGIATSLAGILASASPEDARKLFSLFVREMLARIESVNRIVDSTLLDRKFDDTCPAKVETAAPVAKTPVPPEVFQQALRDFDDKTTVEEVRRIRETSGLALSDFYDELEQLIYPRV